MIDVPDEILKSNPWFKNGVQLEEMQAKLGKPLCMVPVETQKAP